MKKLLVGLIMVTITSPAFAEWEWLGDNDVADYYIETNSIEKVGRYREAWTLEDYKKARRLAPEIENGKLIDKHYSSEKVKYRFHCSSKQIKHLVTVKYSGQMAYGYALETFDMEDGMINPQWNSTNPGTLYEFILKRVCRK